MRNGRRQPADASWVAGTLVLVAIAAAAIVFLHPADRDAGDAVAQGAWKAVPASGLAGRSGPSVVWTRKAMIVWGGAGGAGVLGDGASYDLAADTWTPLPPAPLSARGGHTAIWTGDKMLVYGGTGARDGCEGLCPLGDGAAYDSISNSWAPLPPAPIGARSGHTAVYLQHRMVVWGGVGVWGGGGGGGAALADGAAYDPESNSWSVLPPAPLAPRASHVAVATTDRMLVWGGSSEAAQGGTAFADGAIYSLVTNSWALIAPAPAPVVAPLPVAPADAVAGVWTGRQLLVWGGHGDGAAYDPDTGSWAPIAPSPLSGRGGHGVVWTGRDMLVWGGFDTTDAADGALYNPVDDSWMRVVPSPLAARQHQATVWTGRQLLVWGGDGDGGELADGAVLTLAAA